MTEIEIKAHLEDPAGVLERVRSFARFDREVEKLDLYWTQGAVASGAGGEILAGCEISAGCADCGASAGGEFSAGCADRGASAGGEIAAGCADRGASAGGATRPLKVRIREEREGDNEGDFLPSPLSMVTYKKKELRGDIEINEEREFSIDDREAFEDLLGDLGFKPGIVKRKQTKSFVYISDEGNRGEIPVTIEISLVDRLGWFIELEILADEPDGAFIERARELLREVLDRAGVPPSSIENRFYTDMLSSMGVSPN